MQLAVSNIFNVVRWLLPLSLMLAVEAALPGDFYLGPSAYYAIPDSALHAKSDLGAQLRFGYQFNPNWSSEVVSEIGRYDVKGGNGTVKESGLGVLGAYHFSIPDAPVSPMILLGAGWMHSAYNGTSDDVPLLQAGLGLNYVLPQPAWSVRADASLRHLIGNGAVPFYATQNPNDVIMSIGIQYEFGRHGLLASGSAAESSTPVSGAGAQAAPISSSASQAAPDQDGDGVPDSLDKCPDTPPNAVVDADGCLKYLRSGAQH